MTGSDSCSILFISQYLPPETGAAPTRVKELCTRWANDDYEVTVLTSVPDYPEGDIYDGYENAWISRETIDGVDVISTKTVPASSGELSFRAVKFVWFMIVSTIAGLRLSRHDVVVATSPQPLTGISGLVVAFIKNSKFVFEIRDLWPESISSLSDISEILLYPIDWLLRVIYRRADRLVVVVRGFKGELVDRGVDADRVLFHPNGVTPEFFAHDGSECTIDTDVASRLDEAFVVSYVGTIGRAHGLSVVLDAAEEIDDPDVRFLLVGTGAEAERLESEASRRGLNSIEFVGRRPKSEVPDYLSVSDVALVHLRDIELFRSAIPSKMFEAMAASTPIVLGVQGEAAQILTEANAGWVFGPENGTALAECIREAQQNPQQARQFGQNGNDYVREHFSWDSIAASYLTDIEQLACE